MVRTFFEANLQHGVKISNKIENVSILFVSSLWCTLDTLVHLKKKPLHVLPTYCHTHAHQQNKMNVLISSLYPVLKFTITNCTKNEYNKNNLLFQLQDLMNFIKIYLLP